MITALFGKKIDQSQRFLMDGTRIPVTHIAVPETAVVSVKTPDKNGYFALQVGFGAKKHPNKALVGHTRGAQMDKAPRFLREIKLIGDDVNLDSLQKQGDRLKVTDVLKAGDIVDVIGISKGKGYAGGVKRYQFKGGPRTHGQSDRERAPGSIGQTTTPGRVYKGKKMAGRMGQDRVTISNLEVVEVADGVVLIKGVVPGSVQSIIMVRKTGKEKKPLELYREEQPVEVQEPVEEVQPEAQETVAPELESPSAVEEVSPQEAESEEVKAQPAASAEGSSEPKEEVKEEPVKAEAEEGK